MSKELGQYRKDDNMKQSKLRSWGAWSATIMLILFVLKTYFKIEINDIDALLNLVFVAGMAWGIWNSPTEPNEF